MNWREQAAQSHYRTAVAIENELKAGHVPEAITGVEELIDALSRSEKRALKSQLVRLMVHIIKWRTQPDQRSRGSAASITNAREDIADIQEETPNLNEAVLRAVWDKCFAAAKWQAEGEMNQESPLTALTWEEVFSATYAMNPGEPGT